MKFKITELRLGKETEKFAKEEYKRLLNKSNKTESEVKFVNSIKELKRIEKSQKAYMEKYGDLQVLEYDVETFMPIYRGIPKWKK